MDIQLKNFKNSPTAKLFAVSLVTLFVVAGSFAVVLRSFYKIETFMERDVRENVQTIAINSRLSRDLHGIEDSMLQLPTTTLRKPGLLRNETQEILHKLEEIRQEASQGKNVFSSRNGQKLLQEYQRIAKSILQDFAGLNTSLIRLDALNRALAENLDSVEEQTGTLMVKYAMEGKDIIALQQIYAVTPFCRQQIMQAHDLAELAITNKDPGRLGMTGQERDTHEKGVVTVIAGLRQTLATLTSADPRIGSHVRTLLDLSAQYLEIVRELHARLESFSNTCSQFDTTDKEILTALGNIDSQTTKTLQDIEKDTRDLLTNTTAILSIVFAVVITVSVAGWLLIRFIGLQMETAAKKEKETKEQIEETNRRLQEEIAERKQAQEALKQVHDELEARVEDRTAELTRSNLQLQEALDVINMSPVVAFLWKNAEGWPVEYVSDRVEDVFGYTSEEFLTGKIQYIQLIHPGDLNRVVEEVSRNSSEKGVEDFAHEPYRIVTRDGKIKWVDDRTHIKRNKKGEIIYYQGVIADITDRKKSGEQIKAALAEKVTLLKEIHHRVKNNMQIITSLLRLQADTIKDARYLDMFRESQMRIQSMALIHDKLYRSDDLAGIGFGEYLKELSAHLIRTYAINPDAVTIQVEAADVRLGLNAAIPCGLLMNELVSNSLKHAFPDDRKGEISITLQPVEDDQIVLTVSDNGIGLPDDLDFRNTKSLGMELVVILAEGQLGGTVELDRTGGTAFKVVFRNV